MQYVTFGTPEFPRATITFVVLSRWQSPSPALAYPVAQENSRRLRFLRSYCYFIKKNTKPCFLFSHKLYEIVAIQYI